MATKIYLTGGAINIDDGVNDLVVINPRQFDWKISNLTYSVRDKIDNQSYTLGSLADIQNESGTGFATAALLIVYLNNLIKGVADVAIQDQTTPLIIASFSKEEASTTLSVLAVIDEKTITVTSATGFVIGKYLSIFNVAANRFYLANISNIAVNVITLDTPLDFGYAIGSFVTSGEQSMNVNGSVTPVVYGVRNTDEQIGSSFDITRIIYQCQTATAIDLSKFGDITGGLTNGIVLRKVDGVQRNVFNAKTNGKLKGLMFDFDPEIAVGNAQDGFTARMTFAGANKMGVTIRLSPGEDLQMIIQDDLTSLQLFEIIVEGHIVED